MMELEIFPDNNQIMLDDIRGLFEAEHLESPRTSRDQIISDSALPEGQYNFCLRAFDAMNPGRALSPDPELSFSGCFTFPVTLVDPPRINAAFCDSYVSTTIPTIPINWTWMRPAFGSDNVEFSLRIVELDPPDRVVNDAWLSATTPDLLEDIDPIVSTFRNISIPDDVTLIPGLSYVIQVIAEDPSDEVRFKNSGRSEPCVFHYQDKHIRFGQPIWLTSTGFPFDEDIDVELEYEIPVPEYFDEKIGREIYVFRMPDGMSPSEAFGLEDYIINQHYSDRWGYDDNPGVLTINSSLLSEGGRYAARIIISDPTESDDYIFENDGKSEFYIFEYSKPSDIPPPEWITLAGETMSQNNVTLNYRTLIPEGIDIRLNGNLYYFIIPEGVSAQEAMASELATRKKVIFNEAFDADSPEREIVITDGDFTKGVKYGAYLEISNADASLADAYSFANGGRSEILVFMVGAPAGTDIVLTYPLDGDRIPFSFFPLIARYEPYNPQYQHWKHLCNLLKNGSPYDRFGGGPGLRWPGGSHTGQIDGGLSGSASLTESESQNIAVYKSNADDPAMYERGANYRWEVNVQLFDDVAGVGPHLEFDKNATFSRGMGPSELIQPAYGAIIAEDSTFNFKWITADAPEKLLPGHRINHANRESLRFFNGTVDEKWVLEVDTTESFSSSTVIFHQEGRIGYGEIDFASGDLDETAIIAALYKELESAESFTPIDTGYYHWRVKWLKIRMLTGHPNTMNQVRYVNFGLETTLPLGLPQEPILQKAV